MLLLCIQERMCLEKHCNKYERAEVKENKCLKRSKIYMTWQILLFLMPKRSQESFFLSVIFLKKFSYKNGVLVFFESVYFTQRIYFYLHVFLKDIKFRVYLLQFKIVHKSAFEIEERSQYLQYKNKN